MGTCWLNNSSLYVVVEYAAYGNLREFLVQTITPLSLTLQFQLTSDVVNGMIYLHKVKNILHRDLKTKNLLVTATLNIKIAGFF